MNKIRIYLCCQILVVGLSCPLLAQSIELEQKPILLSSEKIGEIQVDSALCSKEVLMTFFPEPIVRAILIQHKIPEDKAASIAKDLSQMDPEVVKVVEQKATKMDPNPLNDLAQRDAAIKIFRETLFENFAKALRQNQVIADDNQIQTILDDMQQIKGKLFVECIKKERSKEINK
jgi:hypothetical protein